MRRFFGALLMLVFALTVVGCVSNKKYNDVAEQLNNAQTQLDAANAQLTVLEEQKAALELQQQNLNAEKAALNARIAQLEEFEGLSAELEEELAQLNEEKEALDARIAETEADLAALQELVAALSNRPVAPTSLELFLIGSTLVGTSTNAAEPDIDYVVTPAGAYTGLYFEVENPEIASVDSLGRVTGLKPGKTKINAWSTLDPSVKDSVDFEVIEAGADLDIVIAAVNEIYAQLNRSYVAEDLALIHASNPSVKISYLKGSEVIAEYVDGELTRGTGYYAYEAPAVDKLEKVTVKGEYGANNVQHNMELTLFVVADLANNAFNRVQMARDIVESYLLPYTSGVEKVSADLALEAEIAGVEIVYTSSAKQIISNEGAYVRPLDDTKVNFQVMYKYQIPGGELYTESAAYDVYANGYNADEKMDYIVNEGSLAFLNGYASNVNINLPAADDKFDAKLTYVSDKPEVYDNAGKYANPELAEATVVTYTVSFEYRGEDLGTREVAVTANLPSVASKAANAFANNNEVPAHFPYGIKGRVGGNALPGLVATQAVGEDTANVAWEALEPELWADGFVLNAQYLRFRETALKATFTNAADEEDKAELELVLNIGAGKTKDDIIVAGRFSQQSSTVYKEKCDTLAVFSYFDPVVGVLDMAFPTYYSGYMFSIQGEFRPDPENPDAEIFYQGADASRSNIYFRHNSIIYVTGKKDNGEGIFDNSTLIQGTGGNWPVLYVNNYTETVKVPFAVHVTGNGSDGNPIVATGFSREFALTVDGYRTCFIVNLETGKVVSGNGKGGLQFAYPANTKYLDLPANHAIYCPRTQSNNAIYNGVFCVQGTTLEVNHHDLHPKNSYFVDTANALLDSAEVSIAKLEAGEALEEGDANPAAALATANARANNARLSDAEKAGFNAAKYAALAARYAALFDVELQALKDSKDEIGFYMEDYVVELQAAYDKYAGLPEAVQNALALKAWLLSEKALYLDTNWTITYNLNGGSIYTNEKARIIDLFFDDLYQHLQEQNFNAWVSQKHDHEGNITQADITHTLPSLAEFKNPDSADPNAFINLMKGDDGNYFVSYQGKDPDHFALEFLIKLYKNIDGTINEDYKKLEVGERHFFNNAKYGHWAELMLVMEETFIAGTCQMNGYTAIRDIYNRTGLPVAQFLEGQDAEGNKTFKYAQDRVGYGSTVYATQANIASWVASYRHMAQYIFSLPLSTGQTIDNPVVPQNVYVIPEAEAAAQINNGVNNLYNVATVDFGVPAPVKPYSTFEGWYMDADLTVPVVWSVEGLGQQDVQVYAKFVGDPAYANTVTIAADPAIEVAVPYGEKLAVPAVPAPAGKVFVGLYEDAALTEAYDLDAVVYAPVTLYPKYVDVADAYVVKFVSNVDGVTIVDQTFEVAAADKKAVQPAVVNPGYELVGWYKEATFENLYDFDAQVAENLTLYAKWGQSFEVSFDSGLYGVVIPSQSLLPGQKATEPALVKEGYSVEGWYTEKAFENKFDFDVAPEGSLKLYAKLVINQHTLTFTDEGNALAPFTGNYGAAIVFPADPVKEHYVFDGWYYLDAEANEVKFTATAMPDASLALYSKYVPYQYTITLVSKSLHTYHYSKDLLLMELFADYHEFLGRTDSLTDFVHGAGLTEGYNGPWQSVKKFYKLNRRDVDDSLGVFVSDSRYHDKWLAFFDHVEYLVRKANPAQGFWSSEWLGNLRFPQWIKGESVVGNATNRNIIPTTPAEIKYTVEDGAIELPELWTVVPMSLGTFEGWYEMTPEGLEVVTSIPADATGDMTLYAAFGAPKFEVKYYDGSSLLEKEVLKEGKKITFVKPEKANCTFEGWFTDAGLTQAYDASAPVTADLVLYAKFVLENRTLTFNSNGGDEVAAITVPHETQVLAPADPSRTGYTFAGWFANAGLTEAYTFPVNLEADTTVYAKWNALPIQITFDSQGGSAVAAIDTEYDAVVPAPEAPTQLNKVFAGWYKDAACSEGQEYDFALPVSALSDFVLYAKWVPAPRTVTFNTLTEEVSVDPVVVDHDTAVAKPEDPLREGYTFSAWYKDASLSAPYDFNDLVVADITLYAKWTIKQYNVTYDDNHGSTTTVSVEHGSLLDVPTPQPVWVGHDFGGWYKDQECTEGQEFNFATEQIKSDLTLYIKWSVTQITLTFEVNGGSAIEAVTQDYNSLFAAPADPTKEGYTFVGWYEDDAFAIPFVFPANLTANATAYAKWNITTTVLTYVMNGGTDIPADSGDWGRIITEPVPAPRTGYVFDKFYADAEFTTPYDFTQPLKADATAYAKWDVEQITLTFEVNGGSAIEAVTQDYNSLFAAPADPTKEGYTFGGWYEDAAFATPFVFPANLTVNTSVYAKWNITQTKLTYEVAGGSAIPENSGDWGRTINAPADPTKAGHNFMGWYKDAGLTEAFTFPVELKADTKIYAKWKAQPRKLTFNSNGGSVVASSTVPYGTIVVKPTDPTREGYVFAGWFDEPALTTPHDFTVGLTSDLTVYAKWEADLTAYNAALAAVVEADYTPTSWAAYQVVVAANVVTVDNTAEEVATATANIIAAQADLVPAS